MELTVKELKELLERQDDSAAVVFVVPSNLRIPTLEFEAIVSTREQCILVRLKPVILS